MYSNESERQFTKLDSYNDSVHTGNHRSDHSNHYRLRDHYYGRTISTRSVRIRCGVAWRRWSRRARRTVRVPRGGNLLPQRGEVHRCRCRRNGKVHIERRRNEDALAARADRAGVRRKERNVSFCVWIEGTGSVGEEN